MSVPDEPGLSEPIPWRDVPVGAIVMYGIPRRACVHAPRCGRRVFDAQLIKQKGSPVALVLDGEPRAWADGARYKILPAEQPVTTVQKLTASTIHKAFGSVLLYVEHAEVCEAEQRKTKAKKQEGHA